MGLHNWNLTIQEARSLQIKLSSMLCFENEALHYDVVAGADVAYLKKTNECVAACVLYSVSKKKILETVFSIEETKFPYIPGLLSFREAPVLINTFKRFQQDFHVAMFDGHGIAHPRRFGLASHIALWLDKPTVGCAKSKLVGNYNMPADEAGSWTELHDKDELIGSVLRTKKSVKPVFVSVGNGLTLMQAIAVTMECSIGYRIPEPIRAAHNLVNRLKRTLQ